MMRRGVYKFPFLIAVAWLLIMIARLIPVGGEWTQVDGFTWTIVAIWAVVYFSAMLSGIFGNVKRETALSSLSSNWINNWIQRLSFISIIGAILIIYEFAITRGYGFSTPIAMIRIMEVDAATAGFEGSWISGFGRMLTPALMVAWILTVMRGAERSRRTIIILSFASAVVFYQQMMFEGGRFYLAALLLMIFSAKNIANHPEARKKPAIKKWLFWISLFIVVCLTFGYMFIDRYAEGDRIFSQAYEIWAENFDLKVNDEVNARLSGPMSGAWLAICMLWAYATQGINELNSLLLASEPNLAWGGVQFPQISQILNKLTGFEWKYDQLQNLPKIGTYITLYGASYVDFGHAGALMFIAAIGRLTGKAIKLLYSQRLNGLAINAPLLFTLGVFSPIVSLVVNLWPAFCWALLVGCTVRLAARQAASKAAFV